MSKRSFARTAVVIALLVMTAISAAAQSKKDKAEAKKLFDAAEKAYGAKNYQEAVDKYAHSLALVPTNAKAHFSKGYSHMELEQNVDALNEFALALSQGYKPIDVYRVRRYIYYRTKNYEAAAAEAEKAIALEPKNIEFLKAAGEANIARKNYPAALERLRQALALDPKDGDVYYYIAAANFGSGDLKGQIDAGEKALANGTRHVGETHYLLGDGYQRSRNTGSAVTAYQKAISADPKNYLAYRNLSELYRSENRYEEAIAISKQGLQFFPADGNIYTDLSWYYSLAGKPADAITAAQSAVRVLPNQSAGYTNLCRAYNDAKNYDQAITACNSALRLKPDDGETYFYLARAYDGKKKPADATKYFRLAVPGLVDYTTKNPNYSDGWYLLGNAYSSNEQYDKAIEAYLKCLELSPKFTRARFNLAVSYLKKKNKPGALEQYNQLTKLDPSLAASLKELIDRM